MEGPRARPGRRYNERGPDGMTTMRTNAQWLADLRDPGAEQAGALAELRTLVLRAALFTLRRARGHLGLLKPAEIEALAEDCAQDALLAIVGSLERFRGDSRFTTWAHAFAVNAALVAARRERWKRVALDRVLEDGGPALRDGGPDPDQRVRDDETLAAVRDAIEHSLSERQRQALTAVVFEGVPLDELARHWGANRNAIYKVLHDARRKLKAALEARGLGGAPTSGASPVTVRSARPEHPMARREL